MGVSRKTLNEWTRKPGFPESVDGKFVLIDVYEWWRDCIAGVTIGPRGPGGKVREAFGDDDESDGADGKSKTELECEKLELENARRRLKLEAERGRLVLREAVKTKNERLFHRIRARLEATPEELASSLPPEIRSDYLADGRQKISLLLRELESLRELET